MKPIRTQANGRGTGPPFPASGRDLIEAPAVAFGRQEIWIYLGRDPCTAMICDGCGQSVDRVHDVAVREVRDLPILDAATWLSVPRRRVLCLCCGPKLERLDWLDRHSRVTRRLAESVVRLCRGLPIKQVAAFFGLHWHTVKELDKRALQRELDPVDFSGVEVLARDEFAIQRGHRYAAVVIEPHTRRVLWVGRERSREGVRPFFDLLGQESCRRIKAVARAIRARGAAKPSLINIILHYMEENRRR